MYNNNNDDNTISSDLGGISLCENHYGTFSIINLQTFVQCRVAEVLMHWFSLKLYIIIIIIKIKEIATL